MQFAVRSKNNAYCSVLGLDIVLNPCNFSASQTEMEMFKVSKIVSNTSRFGGLKPPLCGLFSVLLSQQTAKFSLQCAAFSVQCLVCSV